jgi:hypothetical protein
MAASPHWTTNPERIWKAAKERARQCANQKNPKLTTLERAFWNAQKRGSDSLHH